MELSNFSSSSSLNTVEAVILETRFPDSISATPVQDEEEKAKKRRRSSSMSCSRLRRKTDDDDHHLLFNPSMSSSFSSTDRFDPINNYPSISSLEIDSHQSMEVEEEEEQRGRREERMSSCSIVTGISFIKEKTKRSSVMKRKKKKMMDPSLHLTPLVPKDENRKSSFGTPQAKRLDYRDRERDCDRDFELMPPPDSHKKNVPAPFDVNQPIDPNEPTYCVCHQVSHGDMIACDMDNCQAGEWFHYSCVGLTPETRFKGNWYCPTCKLLPVIMSKAIALESVELESSEWNRGRESVLLTLKR